MSASRAASNRSRQAMLRQVGEQVRGVREGRGLSRRALADASGVSERFLAELEAGEGNISVARLADVAEALEASPAALLGAGAGSSTRASIDQILDGRGEAELREVRAWLNGRFQPNAGPVVALLGVRGAGKSTVG